MQPRLKFADMPGYTARSFSPFEGYVESYAAANGALVGVKPATPGSSERRTFAAAPVSATPFAFPAHLMLQAWDLAPLFNRLVEKVAGDFAFLETALESAAEADEFTSRLLLIAREIDATGPAQHVSLGIHRSDYMLHCDGDNSDPRMATGLLQVELNTVSASFGHLSKRLTRLSNAVMERCYEMTDLERGAIPRNDTPDCIAYGLYRAHEEYCRQFQLRSGGAAVAMVVQPGETNIFDQFGIEQALFEAHGVELIRLTLLDLSKHAELQGPEKALFAFGRRISVVYYRAGYGPADYPSPVEWAGRLAAERSSSIKCPSVFYQLVGTKKVQQLLSEPQVLRKFASEADAERLEAVFAGLYALDEASGGGAAGVMATKQRAIDSPDSFVLKPQREGGGHNFYGQELLQALKSMSHSELAAHILMDRILPPTQRCALLRGGRFAVENCVCELGVYSVFLGNKQYALLDAPAGYLLRVKPAATDEGGVAAGYACLGAPLLVGERREVKAAAAKMAEAQVALRGLERRSEGFALNAMLLAAGGALLGVALRRYAF